MRKWNSKVMKSLVLRFALFILIAFMLTGCSSSASSQSLVLEPTTESSETNAQTSVESTVVVPSETTSIPIELIEITNPVVAGSKAEVKVKGLPDTEYFIGVYYSAGKSEAKGLEAKRSDSDGNVSWSWTVGAKTRPGDYNLTIGNANQKLQVNFTVK